MVKYSKVIGGNTDLLTAQAFIFAKDPSFLFVLISGVGEDVFSKVRQSSGVVEENFFEQDLSVSSKFTKIFTLLQEQLKDVEQLKILVAFLQENSLYLQVQGNHQCLLLRQEEISDLVSQPDAQMISGHLQKGDKLLFLSSRIIDESLGLEDSKWDQKLIESAIRFSIESFEDEAEALILQTDNRQPFAIILAENQPETAESEPEDIHKLELDQAILQPPTDQLGRPKKRLILILATILLILGLFIAVFLVYKNSQFKKATTVANFYLLAQDGYNQAQSLTDSDPSLAKQKLNEAKNNLEQALKIDPHFSQAQSLKKQIEQNSDNFLKIYKINDWPLFLSLDLIKQDFTAAKMSFSLDQLLLLDQTKKTLVAIDINKKTPLILAGSQQLGQAKFASINGETAFVYSEDKGIIKVDLSTQKVSPAIKKDDEWGKIDDIFAFAGNLYLLDSIKNQIWKYVPIVAGFPPKSAYLKENKGIDLAGSKNMQIDFSVWVLKSGPDILRFTGGAQDNFSVGGLDKPLGEIAGFYISEKQDFAYFLDSKNSRLVVLKKNGQYKSQYQGDKFKTATDLVVDEKNKKIYLLESNKIYQIDLK